MLDYVMEWGSLLLRWLHVITAIAWIGSSFYFVWLDLSLRKRDGMPKGDTLRIAMAHTGANLFMAIMLLPWVHHIAKFLGRF